MLGMRHKTLILGGGVAIVLIALAILSQLGRSPISILSEGPSAEEVAQQEAREHMLGQVSASEVTEESLKAERSRMLHALTSN